MVLCEFVPYSKSGLNGVFSAFVKVFRSKEQSGFFLNTHKSQVTAKANKVKNQRRNSHKKAEPSNVSYDTKPAEPTKCELRLFLSRTNKLTLG